MVTSWLEAACMLDGRLMMEALKTSWAMDTRALETSRLVEAPRLMEDPRLVEAGTLETRGPVVSGTLEPSGPVESRLMKAWESLRVEVLLPVHSCDAGHRPELLHHQLLLEQSAVHALVQASSCITKQLMLLLTVIE